MPAVSEMSRYAEPAPQRVPFAFDLQREYDRIAQHGDSYRDFFISQSHYYAKESYGKVPRVKYEHAIERQSDGSIKLRFGPGGEYAEESYAEPTKDSSLPDWYVARSFGDVRWTRALQTKLQNAKPGDAFVDLSPTEFGVSVAERKKWGFGWHSFVRVHEYVVENGEEKLVSRAIRNYLDLPEQEELFYRLSGQKVEGKFLLGSVGKLKDGLDMGIVDGVVQELYVNTPDARKIVPPELDQLYQTNEYMNEALSGLDNWLEGIFYMMKQKSPKAEIQKHFRGWENAVKDLTQKKKINISFFESITPQDFGSQSVYRNSREIGYYTEQKYKPGSNGCGSGSGFSDSSSSLTSSILGNDLSTIFGKMNHQSLSNNEEDYSFDQAGPCRSCGGDMMCGPCKLCRSCDRKAKNGIKLKEFEPAPEESYQEAA